jgi:hypothetical protein
MGGVSVISLSITTDAANLRSFLVRVEGELHDPRGLNAALGSRLADELQDHFRTRNSEPNRMGAPKTNFWQDVAEATSMIEATPTGATVAVAEVRFRVHLFGGVIRPTGGRKFLTIPLIKEARGLRVADYEKQTGRKLFRLPNTGVLVERSAAGGERFLSKASTGVIRGKNGFRKISIGEGSKLRVVYALKTFVTIKQDPRALPPMQQLITALLETGNQWAARQAAGATPTN